MTKLAFRRESLSPSDVPQPQRTLGKRVLKMTLVWIWFGIFIGATSVPGGDVIGVVSGVVAGIILLPWLGILLGLIGGQAKETLFGGMFGALVGVVCGILSPDHGALYSVNMAVIIGGIIGANYSAILWRRKRHNQNRLAITN